MKSLEEPKLLNQNTNKRVQRTSSGNCPGESQDGEILEKHIKGSTDQCAPKGLDTLPKPGTATVQEITYTRDPCLIYALPPILALTQSTSPPFAMISCTFGGSSPTF